MPVVSAPRRVAWLLGCGAGVGVEWLPAILGRQVEEFATLRIAPVLPSSMVMALVGHSCAQTWQPMQAATCTGASIIHERTAARRELG